ncbi:GAF domain-like protein [Panus rudis PR-1116 ss-1]|nr:GAF domain-like protein [Panus rudis PR-1116 ss-1]
MPHADAAYVPTGLSKPEFWSHVYDQLAALLDGQRTWVSNLANASALIYNSLLAYPSHFGDGEHAVNWCGFYIESAYFPSPRLTSGNVAAGQGDSRHLLLGPFCGKPACQFINVTPGKARGVCADAFMHRQTKLVADVDAYPGHIACDGETKSEIVCPLIVKHQAEETVVGVLDLDCLALGGFDSDDEVGLTRIAELLSRSCDW